MVVAGPGAAIRARRSTRSGVAQKMKKKQKEEGEEEMGPKSEDEAAARANPGLVEPGDGEQEEQLSPPVRRNGQGGSAGDSHMDDADDDSQCSDADEFRSPSQTSETTPDGVPQKRPTPDNRDFVRPTPKTKKVGVGRLFSAAAHPPRFTDEEEPSSEARPSGHRFAGGASAGADSEDSSRRGSGVGLAFQSTRRPTPDSEAFQRLGQLRRRSHSSTPASFGAHGATPSRIVCPPTPKRTTTTHRKIADLVPSEVEARRLSDQQSDIITVTPPPPTPPHKHSLAVTPGRVEVIFSVNQTEEERMAAFRSCELTRRLARSAPRAVRWAAATPGSMQQRHSRYHGRESDAGHEGPLTRHRWHELQEKQAPPSTVRRLKRSGGSGGRQAGLAEPGAGRPRSPRSGQAPGLDQAESQWRVGSELPGSPSEERRRMDVEQPGVAVATGLRAADARSALESRYARQAAADGLGPTRGARDDGVQQGPSRARQKRGSESDESDSLSSSPEPKARAQERLSSGSSRARQLVPRLAYIETIGQGTFATVSIVQDTDSEELFALKVNRQRFESQQTQTFRHFRSSTLAWAALGPHTNIVPLLCAWAEPGSIKVQMELCEGGNLLQYVDWCMKDEQGDPSKPWEESQMWRCLGDAAAGLAHIHASGFCHNDIKPGNLFVGGSSPGTRRLMVGDFGNIKQRNASLDGDEGDFRYLSKEALQIGKAAFASDVFSLGISFYEVVADVVLPEVGMWHELRDGSIPPLPARLSRDLYNLLCRMMHPDPEQRPSAAQVLAHRMVAQHRGVELLAADLYARVDVSQASASAEKAKRPESTPSAFVTTPLADSLMTDVVAASAFRAPLSSSVAGHRSSLGLASGYVHMDSGRQLGGSSGDGLDLLSGMENSNDTNDSGISSSSPRRCLLSYFDDMECQ